MNEQFKIEKQYQLFLERMDMKEENMHETQKEQLRQTFYGACGQILILLRDELTQLDDNTAMKILQDMINQVGNFYLINPNIKNNEF